MALRAASQAGVLTASSQITGTTTNDNAVSGRIGEFVTSTIPSGSAVSLTTTVAADITSISLTAGDWDVRGQFANVVQGSTVTANIIAWINTASATDPGPPNNGAYLLDNNAVSVGSARNAQVGIIRVSTATTVTVYLSTKCSFSGGTMVAYGSISARRVR